jgi:hypothetical protein
MKMIPDLRDIPEHVIKELKKADHAQTEELFNIAIRVAALCQQKLQLRGTILTLDPAGNVQVATIFDAAGKSEALYATIGVDRKMTIRAGLSAPKDDDYAK